MAKFIYRSNKIKDLFFRVFLVSNNFYLNHWKETLGFLFCLYGIITFTTLVMAGKMKLINYLSIKYQNCFWKAINLPSDGKGFNWKLFWGDFDFQIKVIAVFYQKIDSYPYPLFLKDVYYSGRCLMGSRLMVSATYWDQIS
jgi:hypothetical protein